MLLFFLSIVVMWGGFSYFYLSKIYESWAMIPVGVDAPRLDFTSVFTYIPLIVIIIPFLTWSVASILGVETGALMPAIFRANRFFIYSALFSLWGMISSEIIMSARSCYDCSVSSYFAINSVIMVPLLIWIIIFVLGTIRNRGLMPALFRANTFFMYSVFLIVLLLCALYFIPLLGFMIFGSS